MEWTKDSAIRNLYPQVKVIRYGTGKAYEDDGVTEVVYDESAVSVEMERLQAEYDAQDYARKRAEEYPAIGDQLDALFHAGVFPAEMAAELQAVKDKYPKS